MPELDDSRLKEKLEQTFRQALDAEMFGLLIFDEYHKEYHSFDVDDESAGAVYIINGTTKEQPYAIRKIVHGETGTKTCQPIYFYVDSKLYDIGLLTDGNRSATLRYMEEEGKTFATKLNSAFVDVLLRASETNTAIECARGGTFDETLLSAIEELEGRGLRGNKLLIPGKLKARFLAQGVIIKDSEINHRHYAGKTKTDLDTFWSDELPDDTVLLIADKKAKAITYKKEFGLSRNNHPFKFNMDGYFQINPVIEDVRAVIVIKGGNQMLRPGENTLPIAGSNQSRYIAQEIIDELRSMPTAKWDWSKLVRLCEEANNCYENENYYALAMLNRTILNHIPPLFGASSFVQVVSSYSTKPPKNANIKSVFDVLEKQDRKIADLIAHEPIRKKEYLPDGMMVNCSKGLRTLLETIIEMRDNL